MSTAAAVKPAATEYAKDYDKYVSLVPEGDVVKTLEAQLDSTLSFLRSLNPDQGDNRYAPDKWSIKEVVGHMIDAERIFAYRALRFGRNDQNALAGFEQEDYIQSANFGARDLADIIDEFESVRRSNLYLFHNLDDSAWMRTGNASDNEVSVRALAYIMAGHELHHVGVIKSKYLAADLRE